MIFSSPCFQPTPENQNTRTRFFQMDRFPIFSSSHTIPRTTDATHLYHPSSQFFRRISKTHFQIDTRDFLFSNNAAPIVPHTATNLYDPIQCEESKRTLAPQRNSIRSDQCQDRSAISYSNATPADIFQRHNKQPQL